MMQKIRPDMDIGKNIQSIRYANKLTQDQVIAKLNLMGISMSKSTYAKLETNRMNIKIYLLRYECTAVCPDLVLVSYEAG